ncbi:mCpol domain-containing protein [Methylobacterium tardum]|uniref:Minimal CRISPR polymerase domain-containing protein n=1 Tax=Methylobacterium tardum TaxID=374432 RepID=A0AA37THQ3_9HYPH|nr:mCpol domain-containing protein [Methylobacterium tardum]URD35802.1 mCpol domain-containing protein [Methylobacterium tardum]GLS72337.1 hypothetical protein GCM10007890_43500 [Methylobacterium tardum]
MLFITVDGDDIGQKISACYLNNDVESLSLLNEFVQSIVRKIADYLQSEGFKIIFCAADGVAGFIDLPDLDLARIYNRISNFSERQLTFSAGVGANLRESYFALSFAKSNGKARICQFKDLP